MDQLGSIISAAANPVVAKERRMRAVRSLAIGLGVVIAMSGCAMPVTSAADEAALKETTKAWLNAYNASDADTIASLYLDDGVLMPPHAPVANGKAAIREFVANESAAAKAAGVTLVAGAAVAGVDHDTGWESGSYTVENSSGQVVDSGSYLSVSRKVNGKWLYVRDTYNSDRPLPAAPPVENRTN
jgi:uncharacterized protein (TIGR02246 family)